MKKIFKYIAIVSPSFFLLYIFVALCVCKEDIYASNTTPPLTDNEYQIMKIYLSNDVDYFLSSSKQNIMDYNYIRITAQELYDEYENNELRADKKYKNKNILIEGVIASITSSILDTPVVSLKIEDSYGVFDIDLNFKRRYFDLVSELNKKQKVSFSCVGDGMMFGIVSLDSCKPIDNKLHLELEKENFKILNNFMNKSVTDNSKFLTLVGMTKILSKESNNFSNCTEINNKCLASVIREFNSQEILDTIKNFGFYKK